MRNTNYLQSMGKILIFLALYLEWGIEKLQNNFSEFKLFMDFVFQHFCVLLQSTPM